MDQAEATEKIVTALKKKKGKTKFYFNDLAKILDLKPRVAKKLINTMIQDEILEYWSSGSTTLYSLKGVGKQAAAEHED
jgi:Mn-dependent DtxR family transcriptional regulator